MNRQQVLDFLRYAQTKVSFSIIRQVLETVCPLGDVVSTGEVFSRFIYRMRNRMTHRGRVIELLRSIINLDAADPI